MTLPPVFYIGQVFVRGGILANKTCSSANGKSAGRGGAAAKNCHKNDMPQGRR
jgi:hypothetical protein